MVTVQATVFKARCLELMDRVAERHETYVITKHGKPVAKLVPADPPRKKNVFGCMADQMEIVGDVDDPVLTEEEWKEIERQRSLQWKAAESRARRSKRGASRARPSRRPGR